jgi:probable rRNA maturation factor
MPAPCDATGGACESESDAEPPLRLHLDIVHDAGDWGAFSQIETALHRASVALERHPATHLTSSRACVALSSADVVRRLNREFRGHDKPTNVLSFPASQPRVNGAEPRQLGDVILAAEVVAAEAAEVRVPPVHHLQHLVVHGLLHLMGYTHETDTEAVEMERLEVEILARIGVADPYAAGRV